MKEDRASIHCGPITLATPPLPFSLLVPPSGIARNEESYLSCRCRSLLTKVPKGALMLPPGLI